MTALVQDLGKAKSILESRDELPWEEIPRLIFYLKKLGIRSDLLASWERLRNSLMDKLRQQCIYTIESHKRSYPNGVNWRYGALDQDPITEFLV